MSSVFANLILDVGDLERSLAFYHDMLNLPIDRREHLDGHSLAYLKAGGTEILLLQQPKSDQIPGMERSGGLVMKFYVREILKVATHLRDNKFTILQGIDDAALGERSCLVEDPDGYAILLAEPVETLN
jgi:lactoylglutathione lyase